MTMVNKRTTPIDQEEVQTNFVPYADLLDIHDTTVIFGLADIFETVDVDGYSAFPYRKFIPDLVDAYDLTHDNSNAKLMTFPTPGNSQFENPTIGRKFFGGAKTPGTEYMIVTDNTILNPTAELAIVGFMYVPSTATVGSTQYVVHKDDSQYWVGLTSKTNLRFSITRGAGTITIDITVPNDAWFSFGFSYDSTNGFRTYINKTQATQAQSGAIVTTATNLGIFGRAAGTALLENGIALSGLAILNDELSQAWMDDYHDNGFLNLDTDSDGLKEITFWPFVGDLREQPNATAGLFIGS